MSRVRGLATALLVLSLGACGREPGPVAQTPIVERASLPFAVEDVRISGGDGSVQTVVDKTLGAFAENTYQCYQRGGRPFPNGNVAIDRTYIVGPEKTATHVNIITLNGNWVDRAIYYTDRFGDRRIVVENERRPLIGADSVARQLFAAATAAPCPATN